MCSNARQFLLYGNIKTGIVTREISLALVQTTKIFVLWKP